MEVIFHPAVKRDLIEALKYYHEVSGLLANEFLAEVRSTIDQLRKILYDFIWLNVVFVARICGDFPITSFMKFGSLIFA